MNSCISAIGSANPGYRTDQVQIYHFMVNAFGLSQKDARRLKQIYDHTGISYRYSVLPDFAHPTGKDFFRIDKKNEFPTTSIRMQLYRDNALDLAALATSRCLYAYSSKLSDSEDVLQPPEVISKITHLITVSCTGMYAPGIDIELVEKLGLRKDTERTCINFMGCYGAMNALKVADSICRGRSDAKVLIVCVELCTIHFQKGNTLDNWVANSLFSDGAAAVIVEAYQPGTSSQRLELFKFHSEFIPEGRNDMGWQIGDTGFQMTLSSKVPRLIRKNILSVSETLLGKAELKRSDISHFAIHPGGRKILESVEEGLEITKTDNTHAYEVLNKFGNMSSATLLFVLKRLFYSTVTNGNIMSFAFGPGLTVESLILRKHES